MFVARTAKERYLPGQAGLKMLFVHTPKCGGSFVSKAFHPYRAKCITMNEPVLAGHLTWREYRDRLRLLGHDIGDYVTFSVVRNPFDWHVSWFSYIRGNKGGKRSGYHAEHLLFQKMEFSDYVAWLDDPDALRSPRYEMGRPVSDWIIDETGQDAVQNVLRQENLATDLAAMKVKYKLRIELPQKRVNCSKSEGFRSYYSAGDVDVIARRHAVDLDRFGYNFE